MPELDYVTIVYKIELIIIVYCFTIIMKSELYKLPKDILVKIIQEGFNPEYLTYEDCVNQEKIIRERIQYIDGKRKLLFENILYKLLGTKENIAFVNITKKRDSYELSFRFERKQRVFVIKDMRFYYSVFGHKSYITKEDSDCYKLVSNGYTYPFYDQFVIELLKLQDRLEEIYDLLNV